MSSSDDFSNVPIFDYSEYCPTRPSRDGYPSANHPIFDCIFLDGGTPNISLGQGASTDVYGMQSSGSSDPEATYPGFRSSEPETGQRHDSAAPRAPALDVTDVDGSSRYQSQAHTSNEFSSDDHSGIENGPEMPKRRPKKANGFPCPYCEQIKDRQSDLNKHIQAVHQEKRHGCPCGKKFAYCKDLERHYGSCKVAERKGLVKRNEKTAEDAPITTSRPGVRKRAESSTLDNAAKRARDTMRHQDHSFGTDSLYGISKLHVASPSASSVSEAMTPPSEAWSEPMTSMSHAHAYELLRSFNERAAQSQAQDPQQQLLEFGAVYPGCLLIGSASVLKVFHSEFNKDSKFKFRAQPEQRQSLLREIRESLQSCPPKSQVKVIFIGMEEVSREACLVETQCEVEFLSSGVEFCCNFETDARLNGAGGDASKHAWRAFTGLVQRLLDQADGKPAFATNWKVHWDT